MSSLDTSSSLSTGISFARENLEENHSHLETHEVINEASDQDDSEELVSDKDLLEQSYQFAQQSCHISKEIEREELKKPHYLN